MCFAFLSQLNIHYSLQGNFSYSTNLTGTNNMATCKCKCNFFTHGALRSSQELVQKCLCIPGLNWNLENVGF